MSIGVLLLNVGTPLSPEPKDVGRYLSEFLMDPYVINLPWPLRLLLVEGLIVPRRKYASSEKYKKVWTREGSPLLVHTKNLAQGLVHALAKENVEVKFAMRYGEPSLREALVEWSARPPKQILLVPLYPQYAEASTLTSMKMLERLLKELHIPTYTQTLPAFHAHPEFLHAVATTAKEHLDFAFDHVLFSYHGLPKAQAVRPSLKDKSCGQAPNCCDSLCETNQKCYRAQCFATTRALASLLNLPMGSWSQSFQSRLGSQEWISPFTDELLQELPKRGVKRLAVLCPSFVADCLETLEEMGLAGRESFLAAGGLEYRLIPCLNSHPLWVKGLAKMIQGALA